METTNGNGMGNSMTRQQLVEFLGSASRHVHFVGIGGSGMSPLAMLMAQQGHEVSGCDINPNGSTDRLRRMGVKIAKGHSARHVGREVDLLVYSTAIHSGSGAGGGHEELLAAHGGGIPSVRRGQLLSALMTHKTNIAVAGTHGKTTTSGMISQVLARSDSAPTFCVGAEVASLGASARMGGGRYFVAEADESDGTLVGFTPHFGVVLNIEREHLDHHGSFDELLATFRTFVRSTLSTLFYCEDCPTTAALAREATSAISFGLSARADYHAVDIEPTGCGSRFTVKCRDQTLGQVELRIPGRQNIVNALAAVAMADQLGMTFDRIASALAEFRGARRRFERKHEGDGILVVDDYAHHPTEVRATIEAARTVRQSVTGEPYRRVIAVFQPHRFSRVQALHDEFARAFDGADRLYVTNIYSAGEDPIEGVTGETLCAAVQREDDNRVGRSRRLRAENVVYEPNLDRLVATLHQMAEHGDLILIMGAGNISQTSNALAERLSARAPHVAVTEQDMAAFRRDLAAAMSDKAVMRPGEMMAHHTTLRVGGPAELWVEPWDERDLSKLLGLCHRQSVPVMIVGRGSNLLVSDEGIEGVVVHLGSEEFARVEADGERLFARAGAKLRMVVNEARKHSLGGFEFMEGIPGSVGGALRMNAGAMGRQTFDALEWVRYVSMAGDIYDADARTLPVSYRSCATFADHVAVTAIFRGEKMMQETIDAQLKSFAQKRWSSQPAKPSAGCIFKNPPQIPAGKLIDELGLKGAAVGKARVSVEHGNFIVTESGARASDVVSLIAMIRDRVRAERGIELETEVMMVGKQK
jgi:UDP-N-acetylmuramate--L-alanine ligase/UDP-N-acetylenolpyruvoylglucosamine reductase